MKDQYHRESLESYCNVGGFEYLNIERYFDLLRDGKWQEAEEERISSIPKKLYKYVSLDGTESDNDKFYTLKHECLWFSDVESFNDPYEQKAMRIDRDVFYNAGYPDEVIDVFEGIFDHDDIRIVCLSAKEYFFLPMWAHYANNSHGFCVEYEVVSGRAIHEVLYEPDRITLGRFLLEYARNFESAMQGNAESKRMLKAQNHILMQSMYIKDISWSYEKEYRIVCHVDECHGNDWNIPLQNLGLKTKRIIAGLNCEKKCRRRLNEISLAIGIGPVYAATLCKERFGIDLIPYEN